MKAHAYIATGMVIAVIFFIRAVEALQDPGIGLRELYVLGGFLFSGLMIRFGYLIHKNTSH